MSVPTNAHPDIFGTTALSAVKLQTNIPDVVLS